MAEQDKPIGETVGRLIDEGKAYARAEADLAKTRVLMLVERYRAAAILAGVALLLAFAALVALTMTLVLWLGGLIGPLGGGLVATLTVGSIAALLAYLARERFLRDDE